MNRLILFLFFALLISSCSGSNNQDYDEYETEESFEDGTYCAYVEYYNPNTGTNSTYTLEVEVESNQVTRIYWSNGGWLDEDHFYPEDLDSDGTCTFTSDKGYEYTVTIIGQDCNGNDYSSFESDEDDDDFICPICGDGKEEDESVCWSCYIYETM